MTTEYKLLVYTAAGVKVAEVTDFLGLVYTKQVNAPGTAAFKLDGSHDAIPLFELDGQIEIWRRDRAQGLAWYVDFVGLHRGGEYVTDSSGRETYTAYCPGLLSLLGRRVIAWYAGTNNRSEFTSLPAESILKKLVAYNCSSLATFSGGRIRNGTMSGLTVQTDAALGNTISWSCAWKNLLEQLQEVAKIGGGDFDLVKTGATAWNFRFYLGQLGSDRTSTVTFGLEYGNMAEPKYSLMRLDEKTVAIVGGQGEMANRATTVRTGPTYSAANTIEVFVDARNDDTTAKMNSRGDATLDAKRAKNEFSYKVLQTPASLYGKHYSLGDLVTARYKTVEVTQKVDKVTIQLSANGDESIQVEMRDV